MSIKETLSERAGSYGDFKDVSALSQSLQEVMSSSRNWNTMQPAAREALQMISSKIARLLNGDTDHIDIWHDIAGYATLVENGLASADAPDWDAAEKRMDEVGQNGLIL